MSESSKKPARLIPRTPKGVEEKTGAQILRVMEILEKARHVYESYGFAPLETGILEYADMIGSFLPDRERPNEGVFAFKDDEDWLALRYDLTAPLARYVAEHYETLPKPFRRYQWGHVFRNEKVGAGRTRQFLQMDADTVGSDNPAADAEICMMMADMMEAVGIARGVYSVRVSNRKILEGLMEALQIEESAVRRGAVMRAIDKYDRLKEKGVRALLGEGREDESGDFTKGAGLKAPAIDALMHFIKLQNDSRKDFCEKLHPLVGKSAVGLQGLQEMQEIDQILRALSYDEERIVFDPSIVRGLAYYTGVVFEATAALTKKVEGALASGGRYDDLLSRFRPEPLPATGMSMGVDRLLAALDHQKVPEEETASAPVIILAMEAARMIDFQTIAAKLRAAGLSAEVYLGGGGMRQQLKYADKRGAPFVLIEGEEERKQGVITIKDMTEGARAAKTITDNKEWRKSAAAQQTLALEDAIRFLQKALLQDKE